jgi:hypothetical protein
VSAQILMFPGNSRAEIRPRATRIEDLPEGAKALVIARHGSRFVVSAVPTNTRADQKLGGAFFCAQKARAFARHMASAHPRLYHLIIDNVPRTLDEIMGMDPTRGDAA